MSRSKYTTRSAHKPVDLHTVCPDFINSLRGMGAEYAEDLASEYPWCGDPKSSPLEAMFDVAWQFHSRVYDAWRDVEILRQFKVKTRGHTYRLDRAVTCRGIKLAIELDGHTYHERTHAQVADRNTRDSALASDGWRVLHFSWHQMVSNPQECMMETDETIRELALAASLKRDAQ